MDCNSTAIENCTQQDSPPPGCTQNKISQNIPETQAGNNSIQSASLSPGENQQQGERTNRSGSSPAAKPEAALKTSDFYKIRDNVPERFNHPDCFEGYGKIVRNPCYQTSSNLYGSKPPSVHTMPTQFHGRSQKFTAYWGKFEMFRNHSLNTSEDKSVV